MTRIEFDTSEFDVMRVEGNIVAHGMETREELKAAMHAAVEAAEKVMIAEAPRFNDELISNIEISFGAIEYAPGGFGGGGAYVWEAVLSIDEHKVPHVRWVFEGTGRFGPHGSDIKPANGNVMDFVDDRGRWTVRSTKGQRPQQQWVENAQRAAEAVIDAVTRRDGGPSITAIPR